MRRWRYLSGIVALSMAILGSHATGAQETATPDDAAGSLAASYLPPLESFGEGWATLPVTGVSNLSTNVFQEAAVGYYGGRDGARAMVMVFLVTEARVATRQAWDEVSVRFDTLRYGLSADSSREQSLTTIPPPRRLRGSEALGRHGQFHLCHGDYALRRDGQRHRADDGLRRRCHHAAL